MDNVSNSVFEAALEHIDNLHRQLEHKQSVIEALQQNIADLTKPKTATEYPTLQNAVRDQWELLADPYKAAVVSLPPAKNAVYGVLHQEDAKPAIPSAALQPAKLPRFF